MKPIFVLLSALLFLSVFSACHRYKGEKPFICKVIIAYEGNDVIGRDEGKSLEKARKEAKDEACSRACTGDSCESKCKKDAVIKAYRCLDRSTGDRFQEGDFDK